MGAMARALPSQLATLLNTLRFVDALNALLARRLVGVSEDAGGLLSATYDELMAWGDRALQARFAGATQYLKAAKSFGLVHYGGEMRAFLPKAATFGSGRPDEPAAIRRECRVRSASLGLSRRALLDRSLQRPDRIVPAMFAAAFDSAQANDWSRAAACARLRQLVHTVEPFASMVRDFVGGSFESELRESSALLDDEFWPSDVEEDAEDEDLRRVADRAAVERVLTAHDLFDVLSLPRECGATDVKKAFLKLSKEVHPDKNAAKRANEAFDRLHTAKETLLDADARAAYASEHPPRAAVAREWARAMDAGARQTRPGQPR